VFVVPFRALPALRASVVRHGRLSDTSRLGRTPYFGLCRLYAPAPCATGRHASVAISETNTPTKMSRGGVEVSSNPSPIVLYKGARNSDPHRGQELRITSNNSRAVCFSFGNWQSLRQILRHLPFGPDSLSGLCRLCAPASCATGRHASERAGRGFGRSCRTTSGNARTLALTVARGANVRHGSAEL